jgi:hypothetical protein
MQALALGEIPKRDHVGLGLGWIERAIDAGSSSWRASQVGLLTCRCEKKVELGAALCWPAKA